MQTQSAQLMVSYSIIHHSSTVNEKTKEKVAIKKLHRPFQSEIFAKRAYRELRLLKHMKHENVSRIKQTNVLLLSSDLRVFAFPAALCILDSSLCLCDHQVIGLIDVFTPASGLGDFQDL